MQHKIVFLFIERVNQGCHQAGDVVEGNALKAGHLEPRRHFLWLCFVFVFEVRFFLIQLSSPSFRFLLFPLADGQNNHTINQNKI